MSSAAALALTSSAWAEQGDTYFSIFGGYSTLADVDIGQGAAKNVTVSRVSDLLETGIANKQNYINVLTGTSKTFTYKTPASTKVTHTNNLYKNTLQSSTTFGILHSLVKLTYNRQFDGEIGSEGWVVGAAFGVELFQGLRGELEAAFRRYDLEDTSVANIGYYYHVTKQRQGHYYKFPVSTGTKTTALTQKTTKTNTFSITNRTNSFGTVGGTAATEGELASFSFMANLWFDLPLGNSGIVPFVGGGIGIANLSLDQSFVKTLVRANVNNLGQTTGPTSTVNFPVVTTKTFTVTVGSRLKEDEAVFAYQFGAGLAYEFGNGMRLSAQYRYFATTEADFGPGGQIKVESNDILLGLTLPLGRRR